MKRFFTLFLTVAITFFSVLCTSFPALALDGDIESNNHDGILTSGESGINVSRVQIRLRELNYLAFVPTGSYLSMTQKAVSAFQTNNQLSSDGTVSAATLQAMLASTAKRATLSSRIQLKGPGESQTQQPGASLNWSSASTQIAESSSVTVYDFNTSTSFQLTRIGGTNHAYMTPANTASATAISEIFAEKSWECRAVLVDLSGTLYAASLRPNAEAAYTLEDGGMEGYLELYFEGSTSDIAGLPDADHNQMIAKALGNESPS